MERKNNMKAVGILVDCADLKKINGIKGEYGYNRSHFVYKAVVEHLRERGYDVKMPELFNNKETQKNRLYEKGKKEVFKVFFSNQVFDALVEVAKKEQRVVSSQALHFTMLKLEEIEKSENVGV